MIVRPHSVLLDSEALSALSTSDRRMQAWATVVRRTDSILYVSTVTLAEASDGGPRDTLIHRAVKAARLVPVSAQIGFAAGRLRATASRRKARDLTVDAVIAATALTLPGPTLVLTSDLKDLSLLLDGTAVRVFGL